MASAARAIYFAAPVSGGGYPRAHYGRLISWLKRIGTVTTDHMASAAALTAHDAASGSGGAAGSVFEQDMERLQRSDAVIADITFPSTGTGFALGVARGRDKRTLCLFNTTTSTSKPSLLLASCPEMHVTTVRSDAEWCDAVTRFLASNRVYLFGPPGAGKSTAAATMAARLALPHLSTGEMLRSFRKAPDSDPALVAELASYMDAGAPRTCARPLPHGAPLALRSHTRAHARAGKLVPASVMASLVVPRLRAHSTYGFILDGYPPSVSDALNLSRGGIYPTAVLVADCDDDLAARRQAGRGARATDTLELAAQRVRAYRSETAPVLATFPSELVRTVRIEEADSREAVVDKLLAALGDIIAKNGPAINRRPYFAFGAGASSETGTAAGGSTAAAGAGGGAGAGAGAGAGGAPRLALGGTAAPAKAPSARFHAHVDAVSHAYLREALSKAGAPADPSHSAVKVYPVSDLHLGPQSTTSGSAYAGVYKSLVNFHEIAMLPDEAFATVFMGDRELDHAYLARLLEVAKSYPSSEAWVEVEENVYEATVTTATGAMATVYDYGETPYKVR